MIGRHFHLDPCDFSLTRDAEVVNRILLLRTIQTTPVSLENQSSIPGRGSGFSTGHWVKIGRGIDLTS
jgi:hypothetical protein